MRHSDDGCGCPEGTLTECGRLLELSTITDYEQSARALLGTDLLPGLFPSEKDPVGITAQNNVAAFADYPLRPRVLVDVSERKLSTEVLGQRVDLPVLFAPAGGYERFHPHGALATVRAADDCGTIMVLSSVCDTPLEDVARAARGPVWYQLYIRRDREQTASFIRRAERAGFAALVVTIDNAATESAWFPHQKAVDFTWSELATLRRTTTMPLVLKGIQTAEDALLCVTHGVDAIVVSNHGGWALPYAAGTMTILPEIVDAVDGRLEVYLDGGVRHGTDVLKALACGARAVLVGRPLSWALAVDGHSGARNVLQILGAELELAMGLCGVIDVRRVDPSLVEVRSQRSTDTVSQLERLARLLDDGYLTEIEYKRLKEKMLRRFTLPLS